MNRVCFRVDLERGCCPERTKDTKRHQGVPNNSNKIYKYYYIPGKNRNTPGSV